jgi:diguanylate cyclase (GGDEF)-like protein
MMKKVWLEQVFRCVETAYIVDEETKKLLWTNKDEYADAVKKKLPCYKAFFGKDSPCSACEKLKEGQLHQWDYYDEKEKEWLKVKNLVFVDEDKTLRVGNFNLISDSMGLSRESVLQISELQKLLAENQLIKNMLEYDSTHDKMTKIFNRNKYNSDISLNVYSGGKLGILYFDLNNLKEVNDKYRHEVGDSLIICLANAITKTSELYKNSAGYRVGGDEFILILPNISNEELHIAHEKFSNILENNQSKLPCVVAIGEAYSDRCNDVEKLVTDADQAMYINKIYLKSKKGEMR